MGEGDLHVVGMSGLMRFRFSAGKRTGGYR